MRSWWLVPDIGLRRALDIERFRKVLWYTVRKMDRLPFAVTHDLVWRLLQADQAAIMGSGSVLLVWPVVEAGLHSLQRLYILNAATQKDDC